MMKKYCIILAVLVFVLGLHGCDTYEVSHHYPDFKSSRWVCEEPYIEISYEYWPDGHLKGSLCTFVWNDATIPAKIAFMADSYDVYEVTEENSSTSPKTYFAGSWKYRNGNLVLFIPDDCTFFNGEYEELVLLPQ